MGDGEVTKRYVFERELTFPNGSITPQLTYFYLAACNSSSLTKSGIVIQVLLWYQEYLKHSYGLEVPFAMRTDFTVSAALRDTQVERS